MTFTFSESFSGSTLGGVPEALRITGTDDSHLLIFARILSGEIRITHKLSGKSLARLKRNYFHENLSRYSRNWAREFPKLVGDEFSREELAEYVVAAKRKNVIFYKKLNLELSNYLWQTNRGSHTAAFIYLYRILEKISFAFPIIYASTTPDFTRGYSALKSMIGGPGNGKGELGFYKTYLHTVYKDSPLKDTTYDFILQMEDEGEQLKLFKLLKKEAGAGYSEDYSSRPDRVAVEFLSMGDFLITLRNHFFHYLNDTTNNIDSDEVSDSDVLFSHVNDVFMRWIAIIFLGILTRGVADFHLTRGARL